VPSKEEGYDLYLSSFYRFSVTKCLKDDLILEPGTYFTCQVDIGYKTILLIEVLKEEKGINILGK
jgi:hypothetical protein